MWYIKSLTGDKSVPSGSHLCTLVLRAGITPSKWARGGGKMSSLSVEKYDLELEAGGEAAGGGLLTGSKTEG